MKKMFVFFLCLALGIITIGTCLKTGVIKKVLGQAGKAAKDAVVGVVTKTADYLEEKKDAMVVAVKDAFFAH